MAELTLASVQPWAAHKEAAAQTSQENTMLIAEANGTPTCSGGWQLTYSGVEPGASYTISWEAQHSDIQQPKDALVCTYRWAEVPTDDPSRRLSGLPLWDYLLPESISSDKIRYTRMVTAPPKALHLALHLALD